MLMRLLLVTWTALHAAAAAAAAVAATFLGTQHCDLAVYRLLIAISHRRLLA